MPEKPNPEREWLFHFDAFARRVKKESTFLVRNVHWEKHGSSINSTEYPENQVKPWREPGFE